MVAIYKRELRSLFTTMTGYGYTAAMLALGGIYFVTYNMIGGYTEFGITLSQMTVFLLICAPLLTMRTLGEERRQKTDQLFMTAPVSVGAVVTGKYLAVLTLYALPMAGYALFPLIIRQYAMVSLPLAYSSLLGYFMAGAAALAVGMLVSALIENPLLSAVVAFFVLLMCNVAPSLLSQASKSGFYSILVMGALVILLSVLCGILTQSMVFGLGTFTVLILLTIGIYLINTGYVTMALAAVLRAIALFRPLVDFVSGVFDVGEIVYYITVIALLLTFAAQAVERRRWQ